jgi:membrane-associated phospholipid phosphatase
VIATGSHADPRSPLLVAACCLCSAHTTLPDAWRWGDAATLTPGWQRLKASAVGYATSVMAIPSGDVDGDWLLAKAQGAAVGAGALAAAAGVTSGLKSLTLRERPDGSDDDSFPSGHASTAAVFGTLTVRGLQSIDVSSAIRTTLEIGAGAMTAGTAWARVEAARHYASDVRVGIALGNLMGAFFTEAFLGLEPGAKLAFSAQPTRGGALARWDMRF